MSTVSDSHHQQQRNESQEERLILTGVTKQYSCSDTRGSAMPSSLSKGTIIALNWVTSKTTVKKKKTTTIKTQLPQANSPTEAHHAVWVNSCTSSCGFKLKHVEILATPFSMLSQLLFLTRGTVAQFPHLPLDPSVCQTAWGWVGSHDAEGNLFFFSSVEK